MFRVDNYLYYYYNCVMYHVYSGNITEGLINLSPNQHHKVLKIKILIK